MFNFSRKDPQKGAMALMQGDHLLSQGDFKNAIGYHDQAIQLLPDDAEILENAYWSRGLAKMNLGNLDMALSDFNNAIKLNSQYLLAYSSRADCYSRMQDWRKAIADFEKALTLEYDSWHQIATENLEEAGMLQQKQVRYEIHIGAGMAYNQIIDFKNCLKHLEAAFEIQPSREVLQFVNQTKERISQLGW
jgi:tetratricopeptide (TPR) repeat protein